MKVTLPDGSFLELPVARLLRDAAPAIGPRLEKAGSRGQVTGRAAQAAGAEPQLVDLTFPLAAGDQVAVILPTGHPRAARHHPSHHFAHHGSGHSAALPGRQVCHRADDRERLLL